MRYLKNIVLLLAGILVSVFVFAQDPDLMGYWSFDDSTATDLSGNENHGKIVKAKWIDDGVNGCLLFTGGIDDYVNCGHNVSLLAGEEITIMAWVRSTGSDDFQKILAKEVGSRNFGNYELRTDRFSLSVDGKNWPDNYKTLAYTSYDNKWSHVAVTYDNNTMRVYLNFKLVEESVIGPHTIDHNGADLYIGKGYKRDDINYLEFNGAIDEVRIYRRALTASEIARFFDPELLPCGQEIFHVEARDATDINLTLNGEVIDWGPEGWEIVLKENFNIIGITAKATGPDPGLRFNIEGQEEMEKRWRYSTSPNSAWNDKDFDDRSWDIAAMDDEGFLAFPAGVDVAFRQKVIWGDTHYSELPAFQPKMKEWGFSEQSVEHLYHPLYSPPPMAYPIDNYQLVLDVPPAFNLLDIDYGNADYGGRLCEPPLSISEETILHDSVPFTRYHLHYSEDQICVSGEELHLSHIPIQLDQFAANSCLFYYQRLGSNLVEVEQKLPVHILPPIDGRMMDSIALQQYSPIPVYGLNGSYPYGKMYPELLDVHLQQSFDAGFNDWIFNANDDWYHHYFYDKVTDAGGNLIIWGVGNYPLYGAVSQPALSSLISADGNARARFWKDAESWDVNAHGIGYQFCPTYCTHTIRSNFKAAVKSDIQDMLNNCPDATAYWVDYERSVWEDDFWGHDDWASYCFCDVCKDQFREFAGLGSGEDLSDDNIRNSFKDEWISFRSAQDSLVNKVVREASNELGLEYQVYCGAYEFSKPFFDKACEGTVDGLFIGHTADGDVLKGADQEHLDSWSEFIRKEAGFPRFISQIFSGDYIYSPDPLENWAPNMQPPKDEFFNPKMYKSYLVRAVASSHGGLDWNNSFARGVAGGLYYIGEGTRLIAEYEDFFYNGVRKDTLASSSDIEYPDLLVLCQNDERLILLFNESQQALPLTITNLGLSDDYVAEIFEEGGAIGRPYQITTTIDAEGLMAIHIYSDPYFADFTADHVSVCVGDSISFSDASSGTPSYWNWAFPGGSPGSDTGIPNPVVSYNTPGSYDVEMIVTKSYGNDTVLKTNYITVHDLPVADAGEDQSICLGDTARLIAMGGTSYSWDSGQKEQSIQVSPMQTTTYTLMVSIDTGCEASDEVTVVVHQPPLLTSSSINAGCGDADGGASVLPVGGTGFYTYLWDDPARQTTQTASGLEAGVYKVIVDDGICSADTSCIVNEEGAPTLYIHPQTATICEGASISLEASGAESYLWAPESYLNETTSSIVVSTPATDMVYTVRGTTDGCSAFELVTIKVLAEANVVAGFNMTVSGLDVEFEDTSVNSNNYLWDFGDGNTASSPNPVHSYTEAGTYTVTQVVSNSCSSDKAIREVDLITNIDQNSAEAGYLKLYPNPSNGTLQINYCADFIGEFSLRIINMSGQVVYANQFNKINFEETIPISLNGNPPGAYQVLLIDGKTIYQSRIILSK